MASVGSKKRKKKKKVREKRKRPKVVDLTEEDKKIEASENFEATENDGPRNILKFEDDAFPDGHCFFHTMYKCIRHVRPNFEFEMASPDEQKQMKKMAAPIKEELKRQIEKSKIPINKRKEKEEGISFRIDLQCLVNIKKADILQIFDKLRTKTQLQNDMFEQTFGWTMKGNLLSVGGCNFADATVGTGVCLYLIDPKLKAYVYNTMSQPGTWTKISIKKLQVKLKTLQKTKSMSVAGRLFFKLNYFHFVPLLPDYDVNDVILEVEPIIRYTNDNPIELELKKLKF